MCIKAFKYELAWAIDKQFQFISNVKMLLRTVTIIIHGEKVSCLSQNTLQP